MNWLENIKDTLNKKMEDDGLNVSQLAKAAGIPETTMRKLLDNRRPEVETMGKISEYLECSIDKLVGRKEFDSGEKQQYAKLSPEELSANLRNSINKELIKNNLTPSELGRELGFSEDALRPFLKGNNQKMLSSKTLVPLADYFQVSIDGMLGRTPHLTREQQIEKPLDNIKNLNPEVLKAAQLIGKSIKNDISKVPTDNKTAPRHVSSVTKKPHSERSR